LWSACAECLQSCQHRFRQLVEPIGRSACSSNAGAKRDQRAEKADGLKVQQLCSRGLGGRTAEELGHRVTELRHRLENKGVIRFGGCRRRLVHGRGFVIQYVVECLRQKRQVRPFILYGVSVARSYGGWHTYRRPRSQAQSYMHGRASAGLPRGKRPVIDQLVKLETIEHVDYAVLEEFACRTISGLTES